MEELVSPGDGGNRTATKKYINCGFVYHKWLSFAFVISVILSFLWSRFDQTLL